MTEPVRSCQTCGHVQQIITWTKNRKGPQRSQLDQCIHPAGPHPMNEFCEWYAPKAESRLHP